MTVMLCNDGEKLRPAMKVEYRHFRVCLTLTSFPSLLHIHVIPELVSGICFHLAHSTLVRVRSGAHCPFQVATLTLPSGTPNPGQSAFWGTLPVPGGDSYPSIWHTQPLLECVLRYIARSRWRLLSFHLAHSTLVRARSEAHCPFQVATLTLPPGTLNRLLGKVLPSLPLFHH